MAEVIEGYASGRKRPIQDTALAVCKARGAHLADANVLWGFRLPSVSRPSDMGELAKVVILLQMRGLGLECGTADDLLPESKLFSKALTDAGITHSFEEFDGGHVDHVAQRLEVKVLPFFSEVLKFE